MAEKQKPVKITSLKAALAFCEKEFGEGAVVLGRQQIVDVDTFPSGIAALDIALGTGGIPQGRLAEIYGAESCGKTTLCLQLIASCQQHQFDGEKDRLGVAAFIDAEHALDPTWAANIGVDMNALYFSQPSSGEEGLEIAIALSQSGGVDLIVVDSVAALTPQAVLDSGMTDTNIGDQARMMSKAMGKLKHECAKTKTTVLFINQIREKIGVMFGNPETTPGGRALKFYSSLRLQISKGGKLCEGGKKDGVVIGFRPSVKIVKNKIAAPFTVAEFDICVGHPARPIYGVDKVASLLEVGAKFKTITRSGSQIRFGDRILGNGFAAAAAMVGSSPDLLNEIKEETYKLAFECKQPTAGFDNEEDADNG